VSHEISMKEVLGQSQGIDIVLLQTAFEFLDGLRESGITNMFGAAPYVQEELGVDKSTSRKLHTLWMETYDGETDVATRAEKALVKVK